MPPTKVSLCLLPTPIHRLEGMSARLGLDLWIKRDDLTGFAMGGNKGRKLEYLLADALAQGAQVVVTCGAAQSNFVRQLGAACAIANLECAAAVMDLPYEPLLEASPSPEGAGRVGVRNDRGGPSTDQGHNSENSARLRSDVGNPQLNRILGIDLRHHPDGTWDELFAQSEALAQEYEAKGKRVYRVPIGGSSPLGAYAFLRAAEEIPEGFDWIVAASSSGSTQTGLAYAFHNTSTKVLGICADPEPEIAHDFAALGEELADLANLPYRLKPNAYRLNLDYVGPGYGLPSSEGDAAIQALARSDGIFLDPIYSAKAFAGMIDLGKKGEIEGRVLFWHTGGLPTLFAQETRSV